MGNQSKNKRKRKSREGTLGIPGLPKSNILGSVPSDIPVERGKRYQKLIPDESNPSWEDGVKIIEDQS